jgi:hypothetical protein
MWLDLYGQEIGRSAGIGGDSSANYDAEFPHPSPAESRSPIIGISFPMYL